MKEDKFYTQPWKNQIVQKIPRNFWWTNRIKSHFTVFLSFYTTAYGALRNYTPGPILFWASSNSVQSEDNFYKRNSVIKDFSHRKKPGNHGNFNLGVILSNRPNDNGAHSATLPWPRDTLGTWSQQHPWRTARWGQEAALENSNLHLADRNVHPAKEGL
jgi:hypothetical protein